MSHLTDMFGEVSNRATLLSRSMEMIAAEGTGVVVLVNRPAQGDVLSRLFAARAEGAAVPDLADLAEVRDYGVGAQILAELGVSKIVLLSNSQGTMVALAGYGLQVVERREIQGAGRE